MPQRAVMLSFFMIDTLINEHFVQKTVIVSKRG